MKKYHFNIESRKPIWVALSEFYLDTELQDDDYKYIATTIAQSPYSLDEVKSIDKYEVFPVLQPNLLNVAGEWAMFDEKWLLDSIFSSLSKRNFIRKTIIEIAYFVFGAMNKTNWQKLEKMLDDL